MDGQFPRNFSIFHPEAERAISRLVNEKWDLAHYTTAGNALNIIQGKTVWMRDPRCMNDTSEVHHGVKRLTKLLDNTPRYHSLKQLIDECHPGVVEQIRDSFLCYAAGAASEVALASVTEHPPEEASDGRLGMWRGYGSGSPAVALVLNVKPFLSQESVVNVWSSPVFYGDDQKFDLIVDEVISNVSNNIDYLKSISRGELSSSLWSMLIFGSLCMKSHHFSDEREWRIMYLPRRYPSAHVTRSLRTINGIPQIIYELPLRDLPGQGEFGMSIPRICKHVIVGPASAFREPIADALAEALSDAGVNEPKALLSFSDIPLRH